MLKGLFRPSTYLDRDLEAWCLETWAFLMRQYGGVERLAATPLVLANTDFFPPTETEGGARAAWLFDRVRALMGMQAWDCELEPRERRDPNARVGEFWFLRSKDAPSGTFQAAQNRVVITYAVDLIERPRELIAVFAHELSHYLLAAVGEDPPGGETAHELATELTVAYAGFGVFAANAAFAFEQHGDAFGQGWSSQRSGYLSERTWAFALALFLTLRKAADPPQGALKPNIAEMVRAARRYLDKRPDLLAPLLAIP